VLAAGYRSHVVLPLLPAGSRHAAGESLAGALAVARTGGGGTSLVDAARAAYTAGMHTADVVAAALLLGGAVLTLVTLRRTDQATAG
jgi:MFS transporter, DHA2 family, multidrug resistance protein